MCRALGAQVATVLARALGDLRNRWQAVANALFTMRCFPQLVATHGNGFGLFLRLPPRSDLLLIATGCNHGAP